MIQKIDVYTFLIFSVYLLICSSLSFGEIRRDLFIVEGDTGRGSGFSLNYNGGFYLCTNQHVVVGQNQIKVENTMGEQIALSDEVLFPTDERDLILIKLLNHKTGFKVTQSINFGEEVTSYGNSAGQRVVTQKIGRILGIGNTEVEYDNPTVSGDSGSAVINTNNQVVAVHTHALKDQQMNDWIEDRPEMHTRRFGTRIDNASWRKTNLEQVFRISKIYNQVFELYRKWNNEFKIYSKWHDSVMPLIFKVRAMIQDGQFAEGYSIKGKEIILQDLEIDSEIYQDDFINHLKPIIHKLPSFTDNWKANYELIKFIKQYNNNLWIGEPSDYFREYEIAFHSNMKNEINLLTDRLQKLPKSWFMQKISVELKMLSSFIDRIFNPPLEKPNFTDRKILFTDNDTTRFLWQVKPKEITFFTANKKKNNNNLSIVGYSKLLEYINECRNFRPEASFKPRTKETQHKLSLISITFEFDRKNLVFSKNVEYNRVWELKRFQPKLDKVLDGAIKSGDFSFLRGFQGRAKGLAQYKTLEGINKRLEPLFDDLCENIYDSVNFTDKLRYIINLSSQYHSDEELGFYNSLK